MRFYPPFNDAQLTHAVRMHAHMRTSLRNLRKQYPPRVTEEAEILKDYRDAIQEFGRQLLKPRGKIDPVKLNSSNDKAVNAFVEYLTIRGI